MDIALKVTTTLGAVNNIHYVFTRKQQIPVWEALLLISLEYKPTGIIIGENYNVTYDKTTGKYVCKD